VGQRSTGKRIAPYGRRKRTKGRMQQTQLRMSQKVMVSFCVLIAMLKLMHLLILQDVPLPIGFWIPGAHTICAQTMSGLTHEKEDGGEVMIKVKMQRHRTGDGSMCRVKGTGTIKVKMHDGAVRTLGMVRHIPKLRKNLIFLETLDKNGYSFKANGGELIISKGSLVIMKGEVQPNYLYRLCGTTITGGAAVSTSKDSDDETQL
ncbi:unnamed protein product, partial [Prunus brigantina]